MKHASSVSTKRFEASGETDGLTPELVDLLTICQRLEIAAHNGLNEELLNLVQQFSRSVFALRQLIDAFHQSPSRSITGSDTSVDAILGITRNGVYKRIDSLGLSVDSFRVPTDLNTLIQASTCISELISIIQDTAKQLSIVLKK